MDNNPYGERGIEMQDKHLKTLVVFLLMALAIDLPGCGGEKKTAGPEVPGGILVAIDQAVDISGIAVARWKDNASFAVTFTFDDNLESHYELIGPLLESYNFRGSFFVNPGRTGDLYPTWEPVKEGHRQLASNGHEIGSHSWTHLDLTDPALDMVMIREEIEKPIQQLTLDIGRKPVSFVHPFNLTNSMVDSIVFEYYRFSRMSSIYDIEDRIWMDLLSSTTAEEIQTYLDWACQQGKWLIVAGHGAIKLLNGWEPVTTDFLDKFCKAIIAYPQPVYVGTMAEVGAYEYLRREVGIETRVENGRLELIITGFKPEYYKEFASLPLTLVLPAKNVSPNMKIYFGNQPIRYDAQIHGFIGTIDLAKQTVVKVLAYQFPNGQ